MIPEDRTAAPTVRPKEPSSGAGAGSEPSLPLGATLAGRYRLLECVGRGGMGIVYRAFDKTLGEDIAVKVLAEDLARDVERVAGFRSEVKLARQITHPNVCRIHDIVQDGAQWFLTMEYVEGASLADRLAHGPKLKPKEVDRVVREVTTGLAAAHRLGIVHRDLKPSNVLIEATTGRTVLADFGIAVPAGHVQERAGTRGYMAPEQTTSGQVDARSDVYALGVLTHELVTGQVPEPHDDTGPGAKSLAQDRWPAAFFDFVRRCLQSDPTLRPEHAGEALTLLDHPTAKSRSRRPKRRWGWWLAGGVALAAVALGFSVREWSMGQTGDHPETRFLLGNIEGPTLPPAQSWIPEGLRRGIVQELVDAWGIPAQVDVGAATSLPAVRVAGTVWRDGDGQPNLALRIETPEGPEQKELRAESMRHLARQAAESIVALAVPESARRPTADELAAVGAKKAPAWRWFRRARREAMMQRMCSARASAREAVTLDPNFVIAWVELAMTHNETDAEGQRAVERAKALASQASGLNRLSRLSLSAVDALWRGDQAGTVRSYKQILALPLSDADRQYAMMRWAMRAISQGHFEHGVPQLEWMAERWPREAPAPKMLASHYLGRDEPRSAQMAKRYAEQALAAAPHDVAIRVDLARALLLLGEVEEARAQTSLITAADPEDKRDATSGLREHYSVFAWHMTMGDRDEAALAARRLLTGTPRQRFAGQVALALVELNSGAFATALDRLAAAAAGLEKSGHHAAARRARLIASRCALALDWTHRAQAMARLAANARSPNQAWPKFLLALTAAGNGAAEQARGAFAELPRDHDNWTTAQLMLEHRAGNWSEVLRLHQHLEQAPTTSDGLYYVADALDRLARPDEAACLYERLVQHPNAWHRPVQRGQALLRLAQHRERIGDAQGARQHYTQLLAWWSKAALTRHETAVARQRLAVLSSP